MVDIKNASKNCKLNPRVRIQIFSDAETAVYDVAAPLSDAPPERIGDLAVIANTAIEEARRQTDFFAAIRRPWR
jgi:hypothetical protein